MDLELYIEATRGMVHRPISIIWLSNKDFCECMSINILFERVNNLFWFALKVA